MDGTPLVDRPEPLPDPEPGPLPASTVPFSETAWFKAGDVVKDDDLDPELLTQAQLEEHYRLTGELPEDVRKRYSMRYGKSDDSRRAGKGDGKE
jgi:hypothetical protein